MTELEVRADEVRLAAMLRAQARQKADVWGLTALLNNEKIPETRKEDP